MNLQPYNQNGLELVINQETGEAFASASAIARMVSTSENVIDETNIRSYGNTLMKRGVISEITTAEIQTNGGLQGVKLYSEKAIREFAKKYNVDLLDKFADCGIRVFLHQLAGYKVTSEAVVPPKRELPYRDATELSLTAERIETINNLTLRELLRDELIDELSVKRGIKQIAAAPKQYTIVKVRARELGYSTTEIGNGSALGKFVVKLVPVAYTERVGKYEVKHYEVNDQLDTAIKSYFGMKRALK